MKDHLLHDQVPESNPRFPKLTPIQQFYHEKCIFITDVTGIVGKVLLEKLLRCCPTIGSIYILVKPETTLDADEVLDQLLDTELFERAKEVIPNLRKKINVVYGDLKEQGFPISNSDVEELQSNVQIVFNCDTSTVTDQTIRVAAEHNICGTSRLLSLLKQFTKLEVLVHVSAIFTDREMYITGPEHSKEGSLATERLLSALEWMEDEELETVTKYLLSETGNTHLLTKALAESVIQTKRGSIPTVIVRPAVISPVYKDPIPGWGGSSGEVQEVFFAAAKGILRTFYLPLGLKLNIVPVDTVANTLITTAWYTASHKKRDLLLVNCALNHDEQPLVAGVLRELVLGKRNEYPLVNIYRYPDFTCYHKPIFHQIHSFFDHYVMAVVGDTILFVLTGKTMMYKTQKRIERILVELERLGSVTNICLKNYKMVCQNLSKKDQEMFNMETEGLNWLKYTDDILFVGRRVIGKEDLSTIPFAKKKAKVWWLTTTLIKWCLILYFFYLLLNALFPENILTKYFEDIPSSTLGSRSELYTLSYTSPEVNQHWKKE